MATDERLRVGGFANKILTAPQSSVHFEAVQAQCAVAVEVYTGIQELVDAQNGISAHALVRTLFETIIGAVMLSNHPDKLEDFGKHGKLTLLRLARSITAGTLVKKQMTTTFKRVADAEYQALYDYFKPTRNWYRLKREDAFDEAFHGAELYQSFYDGFYGRTSAIAHGEPFNVFQHQDTEAKTWRITPRYAQWREKWPLLADVMSMFLMLHMIARVSQTFALGLENELSVVNAEVEALAGKHMESARSLPDVDGHQ